MIMSARRLGRSSAAPARAALLIALVGLFVLGPVAGCGAQDGGRASLEATMAAFLDVLRAKDVDRLPEYFPPGGEWRYAGTISDPPQISVVVHGQLEADLSAREGWYVVLVDADGDDCFCDYADLTRGEPWVRRDDTTFEPPGNIGGGLVYVRWRLSGGRWVVDTIAEPSS